MERDRVRANYNAKLSPAPDNFHLPPKPPLTPLGRRIDSAEISIFDAERYFNGVDQGDTLNKKNVAQDSSVSSGGDRSYGRNTYFRTRSFRAPTPTASSEASWNSQTDLLAKPRPGSALVSASERRKGSSTSSFRFRKFFGRHCPCHGKKSVEVEDRFSETMRSIRSHNSSANAGHGFPKPADETIEMTKFRICATEPAADIGRRLVKSGAGSFSLPVLVSPVTTVPPLPKEFEVPARVSLEVFRPSVELINSSPPTRDDGVASDSDTSSDLFELESLSAHSSAPYHRRRCDSLDKLPKIVTVTEPMAPPSECCYAPSEASVEWSVTTAEDGFERTSVADLSIEAASEDCREVRSVRTEKEVRFDSSVMPARNEGGGVKERGSDGGLLNCRSEKAVSVGPDPVRFVPNPL